MPHITNFGSNKTENGWIYRNIEDKMIELDKQIQELKNLIDSSDIQLIEYANLVNEVSEKAPTTYVKRHIDDGVAHITAQERARWNRYLDGLKLNLNFVGSIEVPPGSSIEDIRGLLPSENINPGDAYQVVENGEDSGSIYIWDGYKWVLLGNITGRRGRDGRIGPQGPPGDDGPAGMSAFEEWQSLPGNEGKTIDEFYDSLKGPAGPEGPIGPTGEFGEADLATDDDITGMINTIWE